MGKTLKNYADWRLQENIREYSFYSEKFKRLLITMFKWENLPDGIVERYIEESLYTVGMVIFFQSQQGVTKGSYVIARATPLGFNIYNEPTGYRAYSDSGLLNEYVTAANCIPIWNDYMRNGNLANVNFFAKRISNIEKTIDCNLEQLKHPTIVTCAEGQQETVKAAFAAKSNGEPLILVDDDFNNLNTFKVWDLKANNHISDLEDTKHEIVNEALTFFGVKNVPVSKKERLIVTEAEQNEEQTWLNGNVMYRPRALAVEQINEKFKLNIKISLSHEVKDNIDALTGGAD